MKLEGKAILVVGGAQGIGRATARLCAQRGARVAIADKDETEGLKAAADAGGLFIRVDIADESSVREMAQSIERNFHALDVLMVTAGILMGAHVPLEEFDTEVFQKVVDVNLIGGFLCVKHTVPLLRKSGHGVVILTSSVAAVIGSSSYAYGSSKGGVNGLAATLSTRLQPEGIRVNVLSPGDIDTQMKRSAIAADANRRGISYDAAAAGISLGEPEGVARVLAWLASDEAAYVRGTVFTR
jgi:NAD(P)-dependent dehydrogenase (short-subunit alcohol dehydrogenase family)